MFCVRIIFNKNSHQTETIFNIKSVIINCLTRNVTYLINDNICKISSVGYTADNLPTTKATLNLIKDYVKCLNILQII